MPQQIFITNAKLNCDKDRRRKNLSLINIASLSSLCHERCLYYEQKCVKLIFVNAKICSIFLQIFLCTKSLKQRF